MSTSPERPHFDGPEYVHGRDNDRLSTQLARVRGFMRGGEWQTLAEIADAIDDPITSISAQLRHLRKPRFGKWQVDRRQRGKSGALYEYRLRPPDPNAARPAKSKRRDFLDRQHQSEINYLKERNSELREKNALLEQENRRLRDALRAHGKQLRLI